MFQWRLRGVMLAVAAPQASFVCVDVSVTEETSPTYVLVFQVVHETRRLAKRLTKQHVATALERAIAEPRGRIATMRTRVLDKNGVFDDTVDDAMRTWISGKTSRPPTRAQLVQWLLSRMILREDGALVLCGEDEDMENEGAEEEAEEAEEASRPTSPPPPPYSAESVRSARTYSDNSDDAPAFDDEGNGDQGEALEGEAAEDQTHAEQDHRQPTGQGQAHNSKSQKENDSRREPKDEHDAIDDIPLSSSYRFEPARERLLSQRRHSHSSAISNAWTEERRNFQLELSQSKRDLEIAQERQRKADAIASLRRKQMLEQSQKILLAHEQKLRDARTVKQSIADTLEYHDIAYRMESQLKQTRIASRRDREKLSQSMRIALGCSGDRWQKGPVLGTGPLSQIEIDLLTRGDRKSPQPSMWVYDLHGRRHHESQAGVVTAENVFDSTMKKIQRLLERKSTECVDLFQKFDLDHDGTLEYDEFKRLLHANGVQLSPEQAKTLFRHFDPNQSGAIDYGELLWGFFNRRAFLKRWQQRKTKLSARDVKQMFFKYDRVGRGALSPIDFHLALDDIGFRVSEAEAKLLCLKFDVNKDGFIDYNEFHAFVNEDTSVDESEKDASGHHHSRIHPIQRTEKAPTSPHMLRRRSTDGVPVSSHSGSDVERILAELKALNETQETIRRTLGATH